MYKTLHLYANTLKILIIQITEVGSGELSGKMLLVRIVENNKIGAFFRAG